MPTPPTAPPPSPPIPIEQLLGARCTAAELSAFPFDSYRFIIQSIRDRELLQSNELIRRLFEGVNEVWCVLNKRIEALETLFEPQNAEARFLDLIRHIVGFGADLDFVVQELSEDGLRRLIRFAFGLWKFKGTDIAIRSAVQITTGFRFRIRNFFDLRMVVDETVIAEDLENLDPNVLSFQTQQTFRQGIDGVVVGGFTNRFSSASVTFDQPGDDFAFVVITDPASTNRGFFEIAFIRDDGVAVILNAFPGTIPETALEFFIAFQNDEFITELRVVDPGPAATYPAGQTAVNRTLLTDLLDLVRISSERIDVVYIAFLDEFTVDADLDQWVLTAGTAPTVANGVASFVSKGQIRTDFVADTTWDEVVVKVKAAFTGASGAFRIDFCATDEENNFFVETDIGAKTVLLGRRVATVDTTLDGPVSVSFIKVGVFDTWSVEAVDGASAKEIRVTLSGVEVLSASDSSFDTGRVILETDASAMVDVSSVEVISLPLDIDRVGPNP